MAPRPLGPKLQISVQEWIPVTKLGRLVKDGKIKSLEEIYLFSLPIKVYILVSRLNLALMSSLHDGLLKKHLVVNLCPDLATLSLHSFKNQHGCS